MTRRTADDPHNHRQGGDHHQSCKYKGCHCVHTKLASRTVKGIFRILYAFSLVL